LETSHVLADGAMGTELLRHGVAASSCLEAANVERPALVESIHCAYRGAGAQMLTTNTFGANSFRLAWHSLSDRVDEFNRAAARLARDTAAGAQVAGSIGPSGLHGGLPPASELRAAFREQAAALSAGGVDLFLCETFGAVDELRAAVLGVREVSSLPILAMMTYRADGRTPLGLSPAAVVEALDDLDIAALGANCCIGDSTMEAVIAELSASTSLPLVARPNAGQPMKVDGILKYPLGTTEFAELLVRHSSRAWLVGGCCGTTPGHIRAAGDLLGVGTRTPSPNPSPAER
jgi:homocysteine S-methyltransferase